MSTGNFAAALCTWFTLGVGAFAQGAAASTPKAGELSWSPYEAVGSDHQPVDAELGRLRVPENRSKPDGATIELAFVRFKTSNPEPAAPVFYLVGGPGPSGVEYGLRLATGRLLRLLDSCDVIAVDQRGTGLSRPNLEQAPPFSYELPLDKAITREEFIAVYSKAVAKCAEHWRAQGVDLKSYNTAESAEDLESLRVALGIERIRLWGESYGTHLGLAYLRKHAAHVAGAVLSRVEGPDDTLKLPSTTQHYLEQLHELVAADPEAAERLPDFLGTVRELLEQLAKAPVVVAAEVDGTPTQVTVGVYDLQSYLANALGLALQLRDAPDAVSRMSQGDWSALADTALELRRGEVGSAMALMMDCSSGASPARLQRIEKERRDPRNLLGDAVNIPYPFACSACGSPDLGVEFRSRFQCEARVLFVSGSLDARTPASNVESLLGGFSNAGHIVVENAGHEPFELLSPEYRALLNAFLVDGTVANESVVLPKTKFRWSAAR